MTQAAQPDNGPGSGLDRRAFHRRAVGTVFSYSLLTTLAGCGQAFAREISPIAQAWLKDMQDLAHSVKDGEIEQVVWQAKAEELFNQVELSELLAMLDFERLCESSKFQGAREASMEPELPRVKGLPRKLEFGRLVFGLKRGQAIPPHGHHNMVTGFRVLEGRFHARHFDRVEDHPDHMVLAPTIDETFTAGSCSTISDYKDNVHWFVNESERGFLFNVHVHHVDPGIDAHGRVFVDPTGSPLADGTIHAPKIERAESFERFGGDPTVA